MASARAGNSTTGPGKYSCEVPKRDRWMQENRANIQAMLLVWIQRISRVLTCVLVLAAVAAAQQNSQEARPTAPPANQSPAAVSPAAVSPAVANPGMGIPAPAESTAPASAPDSSQDALHLGPGDLVDVAVFGAPDLAQEFRISSTGD